MIKQVSRYALIILGIILATPSDMQARLRWSHTPKCECSCHDGQESCRDFRKGSYKKKPRSTQQKKRTSASQDEQTNDMLDKVPALIEEVEEVPDTTVSEVVSDNPFDRVNSLEDFKREFTPEQRKRIMQAIDEFEEYEDAVNKYQENKDMPREFNSQDEDYDLGLSIVDDSSLDDLDTAGLAHHAKQAARCISCPQRASASFDMESEPTPETQTLKPDLTNKTPSRGTALDQELQKIDADLTTAKPANKEISTTPEEPVELSQPMVNGEDPLEL